MASLPEQVRFLGNCRSTTSACLHLAMRAAGHRRFVIFDVVRWQLKCPDGHAIGCRFIYDEGSHLIKSVLAEKGSDRSGDCGIYPGSSKASQSRRPPTDPVRARPCQNHNHRPSARFVEVPRLKFLASLSGKIHPSDC